MASICRGGGRRARQRWLRWRARPWAVIPGAGLIDCHGPALERLVVETPHRLFGLRGCIELHEREAARAATLPVRGQVNVGERADCREVLSQLRFGRVKREITDKETDWHNPP